jgi:hypothetical protein
MTAAQRRARREWQHLKSATPPRQPHPRKGMDRETEDLALRRSQMMRGR